LSLSLEDTTDLRKAKNDVKITTNNAIDESLATVQQRHCISIYCTFYEKKHENLCNKLGDLAKNTEAANFRVPSMSEPDRYTAMEKQDNL
jgi:hypothetical protein